MVVVCLSEFNVTIINSRVLLKMFSRNTYIIPVSEDFLVYNPFVGLSALLNRPAVVELKKQLRDIFDHIGDPESKLFDLARDIQESPMQDLSKKINGLNPDFLGVIPTRICNGACNYCDFSAEKASSEKMSYSMAVSMVDWYAGLVKSLGRKTLNIHFFGGEPMMASDIVEIVVHRARLVSAEKDLWPLFEISTNGQFSDDIARFLGDYFNKVVLSLDGFADIQDIHRPLPAGKSSFQSAVDTAEIIGNSNADLNIRCCISRLNVSQMQEITVWFCQNFRLSAINFEILSDSLLTASKGLYPPDPVDFALQFQKAREIADGYGVEVVYASDISNNPQVSSCPVGNDTVIVSPDGRISSCYLMPEKWIEAGLELDFGSMQSQNNMDIDMEKLKNMRTMVENKPRCSNCFCRWSCAGGCHVGNTFPGSRLEYDDFCKQTRLISILSLLLDLGKKDKINDLYVSSEAVNSIIFQKSDRIEDINNSC